MASPKRILLCGIGPLPYGEPERLFAPGLRLWGFAQALLRNGLRVDVLEIQFGETESGRGARLHELRLGEAGEVMANPRSLGAAEPQALVRDVLATAERGDGDYGRPGDKGDNRLSGRGDDRSTAGYDAIVSTTDVMNKACAEAAGALPLWCDFFGHPMAERQSQAFVYGSDEGIAAQWDYVLPALLRGDRFSGCSQMQRLAIVGELGACGRLNRRTDGYPLVSSLPQIPVFKEFSAAGEGAIMRGKIVPRDALIALWTGGYNTWADVETLARGLILAMERIPNLHYVSTGGAIAGHDDRTFGLFRAIVDASAVADRFHFVGWVLTRDVPRYYLEADFGINCDRRSLEGELGTRNRIIDWVCARLPVVSTDLCELTHLLAQRNFMIVFGFGDPEDLARALVEARGTERDPRSARDARAKIAEQAREWLLKEFDAKKAYAPLLKWASSPHRAPDLSAGAAVRVEGCPFEVANNGLSIRRGEEYVRGFRGKSEKEGVGSIAHILKRLRGC